MKDNTDIKHIKPKPTLQIECISDSHEEGFIDTDVGVALSFTVDETQYINIYRRLQAIQQKIQVLYKAAKVELKCDIQFNDYPVPTNRIFVSHEVSFQSIHNNNYPSLVLNVAMTGAAAYTKMVFEEFSEYNIIDCNRNKLETSNDAMVSVCNGIEEAFYFMIESISDDDGDTCFDFTDKLVNDKLEECVEYVKSLDDDNYTRMVNVLSEELGGEFGADYKDGYIKISDINPLNNTISITDKVAAQCINIKYNDLITYIKK